MKIEITKEDLHSLSKLVMLSKEEFLKHFEGKDLGYVLSMKNFVSVMFNDGTKIKDELVVALPKFQGERRKKAKMTLQELYGVLQNLEDKFYLLKEMEIKRRSIPL